MPKATLENVKKNNKIQMKKQIYKKTIADLRKFSQKIVTKVAKS